MGKVAVVSNRGMLSELVHDGVSGYVVSDAEMLAEPLRGSSAMNG